jgi:general secretion pathway protein L
MKFLNVMKTISEIWIDGVTRVVFIILDRFNSTRKIRIVEQDDGSFRLEEPAKVAKSRVHVFSGPLNEMLPVPVATLIKGSRTELVLNPRHLLFRSLELPRRASEFIDGIIRAKIDSLTPWTAEHAIFGYTVGTESNDRINLTIAATAKSMTASYINMLNQLGAQSVLLSTTYKKPDATIATIRLTEQIDNTGRTSHVRIRKVLRFTLLAAIAGTAAIFAITTFTDIVIQNKKAEISRAITAEQLTAVASQETSMGVSAATRTLEQRKREIPLSVILLEALSRTLPDDTYLTELRIQENKIQIVGVTGNAPALISLIEKSSHFDHATFFAPTTRAPNDLRERFHIEANIRPGFPGI